MIGALSFTYEYCKADICSFTLCFENQSFSGKGFLTLLNIFEKLDKEIIIYVKNLQAFYLLSKNFICYDDGKGAYSKDKGINIFWLKTNKVEIRNWDNFIPNGMEIKEPEDFLKYLNGLGKFYQSSPKSYQYTLAKVIKSYLIKKFFLLKENDYKEKCLPNEAEYEIYKGLSKGGFYWTNPLFFGKTIQNVYQYDAKTNHASQMARKLFPSQSLERISLDDFQNIVNDKKWCWAIYMSFKKAIPIKDIGIRLEEWGAHYDKKEKKWHMGLINPLAVIFKIFKFEDLVIELAFAAKASRLPNNYYSMIKNLYETKESAKGVAKSLAKFQTEIIYGHSIKTPEYIWSTDFNEQKNDFVKHYKPEAFDEITKKIKNNLMPFQVGIWTLAYSNADLINLVLKIGLDKVVYCDTDCVKFIGENGLKIIEEHNKVIDEEFEQLKKEKQFQFPSNLGRWCDEGIATRFKSIGIKWYLKEVKGKLDVKAAGADKDKIKNILLKEQDPFKAFDKDLANYDIFKTIYYNKERGWIESHKSDIFDKLMIKEGKN